jgi:hypothetical protein
MQRKSIPNPKGQKTNCECTFVFHREDIDRIVAVYPKGHKDYPSGYSMTIREEMEKGSFLRDDIAMVNMFPVGNGRDQVCCYAYEDGSVEWNGVKDFFTGEEQDEIRQIAWDMFELAKTFRPMRRMLHKMRD